jgi:hypothetical protein
MNKTNEAEMNEESGKKISYKIKPVYKINETQREEKNFFFVFVF